MFSFYFFQEKQHAPPLQYLCIMAGIYLHIPFCKQACTYCNFHFSTSLTHKAELLQALRQEMMLQKEYLGGATINTIYFGGGTPSLLSYTEISRLFEALENTFPQQSLQEITLEANPDDLTKDYLRALSHTPINRLSIGVQSFRESDLHYMNRAHNAQQADYAIKAAQDMGFDNLSIDLIYGTPGLNDKDWLNNIKTALSLHIPHISSYALTVEPRTALAHQIAKGTTTVPEQAQAAGQLELLMATLATAGYDHYEIANFALPGKHALHNTNYWRGAHYLGLGPSAHSFDGRSRQWNVANNSQYRSSILQDNKLQYEREELSVNDQFNEYLMTSLRTMWGCDLAHISQEFGPELLQQLLLQAELFIDRRQMIKENGRLLLTNAGKLMADGIASELFRI